MLIPCILSFASLVVTLLVLLIGGQISLMTFIFAFILTTLLLIIFDIISLRGYILGRGTDNEGRTDRISERAFSQ